ncbi:MAG: hypothetical protein AAF587_03870 [Bacteroidota bacterium]
MKRPILAALGNFFLMGLGYVYNRQKILIGSLLTIGAISLTVVEFQVKELDANVYALMFGTVFLINTALAIDAFKEAQNLNQQLTS